jgi:hypothetical protein
MVIVSFSEIAKNYFKVFSDKDIKALDVLFADNVRLKDWEIEAKGREEVLRANANIFKNVESIKVQPLNIVVDGKVVFAELLIDINNGQQKLPVVDVIKFNDIKQIESIRAYRGI